MLDGGTRFATQRDTRAFDSSRTRRLKSVSPAANDDVCGLVGRSGLRGRPCLDTSNRARVPKARHEAIGERDQEAC
jgi:hypothetical protein